MDLEHLRRNMIIDIHICLRLPLKGSLLSKFAIDHSYGVKLGYLHICSHMCKHKSKNKMLSFLFIDSGFILRRSILYSLRIQFNSLIEDEENINMYDKRDYFNNPLVTDLADLLSDKFDEITMDGDQVKTSYRTRIMMMLVNMDRDDDLSNATVITESPLKGPTTNGE